MLPFAELWPRYGVPVVFFDHLGCASSTHLPQTAGDKNFWTPELSTSQLDSLIDFLGLRDGPGFHFLGQSFGGMIGSSWAGTQPRGLQRLVLASANASKELSMESMRLRINDLPIEAQQAIQAGTENEDYDNPAYKAAIGLYMRSFLCRAETVPPEMQTSNKNLADDKTVFSTMSGPALLNHTGSMIGWTAIPTLHKINVPTLVYNGEYDTSHDVSQIPFFENIPRVRWITLAGAGHMPHVENDDRREKVLKLVGDFLTQSSD